MNFRVPTLSILPLLLLLGLAGTASVRGAAAGATNAPAGIDVAASVQSAG